MKVRISVIDGDSAHALRVLHYDRNVGSAARGQPTVQDIAGSGEVEIVLDSVRDAKLSAIPVPQFNRAV
jgi:hypothetical protein